MGERQTFSITQAFGKHTRVIQQMTWHESSISSWLDFLEFVERTEVHKDELVWYFRGQAQVGWGRNKRLAAELGDELATVIEEKTASEFLASGVSFKPFQVWEPHRDVSCLYIGHNRQSLGGYWIPGFGGEYKGVTANDIQETVRRKEAKLKVYKLVAPTVWLLIDCDLSGQGIALDVSRLSSNVTVISEFDKVFCCGFGRFEWVEIPYIND